MREVGVQRVRSRRLETFVLIALMGGALAAVATASTLQEAQSATRQGQPSGRVLLFYDMEGASGIDEGRMFDSRQTAAFDSGRRFLASDVNAVIEGLLQGGAAGVDVFNTHGSGGDTLVSPSLLDPRARILSRRGPRVAYDPANGLADSGYVAAVSIAAYDKPQSGGFSPHTITVGTTPVINGRGLTETDLLAYAIGTGGVPLILASGDDVLGRSLRATIPWIEYVTVKRSTPSTVELRPTAEVRPELRAAALRAMQELRSSKRMQALRLTPPIRAGLLPSFPAWLYPTMADLPGIERQGDTVYFTASDYRGAYRGTQLLSALASASAEGVLVDILRRTPEGRRLVAEAYDTLSVQAQAFERRTGTPPSQE
jgi:D-amino peptidase